MIGVALLSFFVWQHHLFQSGINPDMRPLFMLTTELISIPTGFIFLVGLGTLWKAKIRFEVPDAVRPGRCSSTSSSAASPGSSCPTSLSTSPCTAASSCWPTSTTRSWAGSIFAFFGGLYYWLPR